MDRLFVTRRRVRGPVEADGTHAPMLVGRRLAVRAASSVCTGGRSELFAPGAVVTGRSDGIAIRGEHLTDRRAQLRAMSRGASQDGRLSPSSAPATPDAMRAAPSTSMGEADASRWSSTRTGRTAGPSGGIREIQSGHGSTRRPWCRWAQYDQAAAEVRSKKAAVRSRCGCDSRPRQPRRLRDGRWTGYCTGCAGRRAARGRGPARTDWLTAVPHVAGGREPDLELRRPVRDAWPILACPPSRRQSGAA